MQAYRTFLYVVRDSPSLRVKYGYVTAPHHAAARSHLDSRYRTYFYFCELLHVVPVADRGVDAEAQLKARLSTFYIGREFLMFPDEVTLQAELCSAFEEAACEEDRAAQRLSRKGASKGERKRLREEAELAAAVEVAVIAKKRRLEKRQQAQEVKKNRDQQRQTRDARKMAHNVKTAARSEVLRWAEKHIDVCDGRYLILADAYEQFSRLGGKTGKRGFKQHLVELLPHHFCARKRVAEGNSRNVFWGVQIKR